MFIVLACGLISLAAEPPSQQPATAKQIQQWIRQLDSDEFRLREQATENLFKAGPPAATAVIRSLKAENPEVRLRAKSILKRWLETGDDATLVAIEKESPNLPVEICQQLVFRWLRKHGVKIDDYKKLESLKSVSLRDTKITDAGLAHLIEMTSLMRLKLSNTKITDAGLAHLRAMTSLEYLVLDNTAITDTGLERLKGMTALKKLALDNTTITDAGLAHLKELTGMETLSLNNTKITDAGLAHLKGMKTLFVLSLRKTSITDAGLAHLKEMAKLKYLYLKKTKITDAGVKSLRESLPTLRIHGK
jgi:hypothetical protein